jgi:hypothetical protein
VKRLLALAAGAFGLRAWLRHRRRTTAPPADELRAKLAESRTSVVPAGEAPPLAESPPVEKPPPVEKQEPDEPVEQPGPVDDVDARRAEVHERARRSIDELS